jgi:hypothetical protein
VKRQRRAILRSAHHVAKREEHAAQQHYPEKQSNEVTALEYPVTSSALSVSAGHVYLFPPIVFVHCRIMSIGNGKTIVVFFSTPISVSVCR